MVSVDSLIRNRETEAHADEWRDRAEKAEARVAELEAFFQDLADDTNPTGPMADVAVHNAILQQLN